MSSLDRLINNKAIQNLFVWLFLFLFLMSTVKPDNKVATALFSIILLAPAIYISNLLILPFLKKKVIAFTGLFLLNTLVFTVVSVGLTNMVINASFEWMMFVKYLAIMVLALVFAAALKMTRDSFARRQQLKEAELELLKAQLNPHFLFNTLNNLYGLAVAKSDKLPGLMLTLSNLLRYSLYETQELRVPLHKEIQYLEDYIALEKIRLDDQVSIVFENNVENSTTNIAPMLLMVFVENAFKHLHVFEATKSHVLVSIEEKNGRLHFECSNTFSNSEVQHDYKLKKGRSGLGLMNVKKRLDLLYPEKYDLQIDSRANTYHVKLILAILH